ncbi:MAG: hypothetical protein U5N55_13220 [Cypionkella sp.]|nr:hypothetical protein [Cypionkella sp.]
MAALALVAGLAGTLRAGPDLALHVFQALIALGLRGLGRWLAAGYAGAFLVAAPMLDFHYYGPIAGRVVQIDHP